MNSGTPITLSVIGLGNIGRAVVLSLINCESRTYHINLVDLPESAEGSVLDFAQGIEFSSPHKITFNSETAFQKSTFIFHCAGVGVKPGASRLTTTNDNVMITRSIFEKYTPSKHAKIIVISNPVDVISYYTWKYSSLPSHQVIGTGTHLDTARLNYYIRQVVGNDKSVNNQMLGEHGESIVWAKSHSYIDGVSVNEYFSSEQQAKFESDVIQTASRIKQTQGATIYAVTLCAIDIMEAMLNPTDKIYNVSCLTDAYYTSLFKCSPLYAGLPVRIGQDGISEILPYEFSEKELNQLRQSTALIQSHLTH